MNTRAAWMRAITASIAVTTGGTFSIGSEGLCNANVR